MSRYSRQEQLPDFGAAGQSRLRAGSALVVGAGGLGSPAITYLTAAGVGRIGIADDDAVSESNLQRQPLYGAADIGKRKVAIAAQRVAAQNPDVQVDALDLRVTASNALELVRNYDLVVDGTDNFSTRYLLNDACVLAGRPYVWASVLQYDAQVSVFWAKHGPCFRCLHPKPPAPWTVPSCAEAGVLGAMCGVIGALQAGEAIKLLAQVGEPLIGQVLTFASAIGEFRSYPLHKDPMCLVCSDNPSITELGEYDFGC